MRNIVLIISCFCALSMWAQKINRPDSYNYTRGLEAFQNNNFEEASDYLNKEINENPDNGYARVWMAIIYQR